MGLSANELNAQKKSILIPEEEDNEISTIESILAGVGSGLIQIPKGVFSLGATLIDLGAGTNKAAQVEKYFDDLTTLDEKAQATTAGKITELLVNIGIPGGIGFKVGSKLATTAMNHKKARTYFTLADEGTKKILSKSASKIAQLNTKGRMTKFAAGAITGGAAEGIFIGDVEAAGTFGNFLGGPTRLHETDPDNRDPARDLVNRIKFGTEGALFTGLIGGVGKTLRLVAKRDEARRFANNDLDKILFKATSWLQKEGGTTSEYFKTQRAIIGSKYKDINSAQQFSRQLDTKIDRMFPFMQRWLDTSTKTQKKDLMRILNDGLISGTPKVSNNGVVKFGEKTVTGYGGINKAHKTRVKKFLDKNKITYNNDQVTSIFNDMESIRNGWGEMFSMLGKGIKEGEKLKIKSMKGAFRKYKELFGTKFKDYLGATYDVFQNRSLIPMFTKPVSSAVAEKAADVFMKAARANKMPITRQEALTAVNNVAKDARPPKNFEQDVLVKVPEFFTGKSFAQKVGSQHFNINQLTGDKRQIVEEILGKTRNPVQTILSATGEVSAVTRRNQLLTGLAVASDKVLKANRNFKAGESGVKRPLLYESEQQIWETARKMGDTIDQKMYRKIELTSTSSGMVNPTSGKWALKEVADAIELAAGKPINNITTNTLYRNLILFPKATAQMAKTILSPITHARNFISAGAFAVANGILPGINITPATVAKSWKSLQVGAPGTRKFNEFYRELAELGVVNTNVRLGDLSALLKDVDFGSVVSADRGLRGLLKPLSKLKNWTQDAYTAEDDFWKMITFMGERTRLANAYERAGVKLGKNLDEVNKALNEEAANIVRNNVPNYDYVSQMVKSLRKAPVGNFVSFPAEILRTSTNIVRRALHEINYKAPNGNKPLAAIGYQRLAGMAFTTAAVPYGAVKMGQLIYDVSNEELAALKRFVAPWSKNSTIIPIKTEDGDFKYIDFSHANAYDTLTRPFQAALNQAAAGDLNEEGIMNNFILGSLKGFGDIASPFVTESIWTEAMVDVLPIMGRGGKTSEGFTIYDKENDTWGNVATKIFMHMMKAQLPGSVKQLGRIDYAIPEIDTFLQVGDLGGPFKWGKIGKYDENGQSYELLDEGLGIAGMRAVKLNIPRTLKFKQAQYSSRTRKSRSFFTKVALKEGPVDSEELVDAYINANRALFDTQKDMTQNINAAKLLNTKTRDIYSSLERLSKKDLGSLQAGIFQPYYPSRKILEGMSRNARKIEQSNPFFKVAGIINRIANKLYRLRTKPGSEFPILVNPLKVEPVSALPKAEEVLTVDQTVPATTGNNLTGLQSNAMNTGQVNQMSGLTRTQEALLSPDEKLIAQGQNQRQGIV